MTREEVLAAIEVGIETARDLVAAGNKALLTGEMGIANTTASAALISVFTDVDPAEVTGRGPASTTRPTPARWTWSAAPSPCTLRTRRTRSAPSRRSAA